MKNLIISKKE